MSSDALAILLFHVSQNRNFIHDDLIPALSTELRLHGVPNDIFETTVPAMDAPGAADLGAVEELVSKLKGRYKICVYTRLWSELVFQHLRKSLPDVTWIYVGDGRVAFEGTRLSLAHQQVPALAAAARACFSGQPLPEDLSSLPNTQLQGGKVQANLVRIRVGDEKGPERPEVVHGSPGCAWSLDIRKNPRFATVPFPSENVVLKGCSFCATGGVPREPAQQTLHSVLAQLDHILATSPNTHRIQLNDQNPLPYLLPFLEHLGNRGGHSFDILLETRTDWFLGGLQGFEKALQKASEHGHKILLFLMGIENFSPRELELLNKGVSAEDNERVVHECRRLRAKYPQSYSQERAAFGFILYNPWTEPADLLLNAMAIERTKFQEFRGELTRAKLRLYPDTALYYKAKHENLLAERFPFEAMDSARRYGYEAEVPWCFQNPITHTTYGTHELIFKRFGKHEDVKMLVEIVRFLERDPSRTKLPIATLAKELLLQLGSRFDREIRHTPSR